MKKRVLGKTNFEVSEIALGTWQVGGKWGSTFDEANAEKILETAVEQGVNLFDTADVYSDGQSEKAIGRFLKKHNDKIYVATKCGRQIQPHINEGYTPAIMRKYVEDSLSRLGLDTLDLIQLHCPPNDVFYRPEIFEEFEKLKSEGKIINLGVSVEKVEQALKSIEYENVTTVQIIFNMFRQRPTELFFEQAKKKNIGVIVRVPLASGLLVGKYDKSTNFEAGDHRFFNRNGEAFDKGETFSGIDYQTGLAAVHELKNNFTTDSLADLALQWILSFEAVSTVIPGSSNPAQVIQNCNALNSRSLTDTDKQIVKKIYEDYIKKSVHHLW